MIKRLDKLVIGTSDLGATASVWQENFDFTLERPPEGGAATISIGGTRIRLSAIGATEDDPAGAGGGLSALWLEADDLDSVVAALIRGGLTPPAIRTCEGRRVLAVDPAAANQVRLYIFDRKG